MIDSRKRWWAFPAVFVLGILLDQLLKFYIKLNFTIGEDVTIFSWFHLVFVENPGMAFGMTLGSKLFLTLFRIAVSGFLVWYIVRLVRNRFNFGYIMVITLVLTGAVGNIIDCLFYGLIFTESTTATVAGLTAFGTGYAGCLMGKVVDMFYCPLFTFPDWVPLLGGEIFFSPIFNLADSYITVCIFVILFGYRHAFTDSFEAVKRRS